jgi:hypothetical protein
MRRIALLLAVFVVASAAACTYESAGTTTTTLPDASGDAPATGPAEVVFSAQRTEGSSIVLESVTLPDPGFIVLAADDNGVPGEVIGISERLNGGITVNVPIAFLLPIDADTVVHATAHIDMDDDGLFEYEPPDDFVDLPAVQANGDPAAVQALVEVLPPLVPGAVALDEQRTDGTSLVVGGVTLPAPGFVAVHMNEGGEPGAVLGSSDLLTEGADLEIALDPPLRVTGLVFVVAYVDRDEDGVLGAIGEQGGDEVAASSIGEQAIASEVVTVVPLSPTALTVSDQEVDPPPEDPPADDEEPFTTTVVFADEVSLPAAGFVRMHKDAGGEPGVVVHTTDLLPAGTSTDLTHVFEQPLVEETTFWVTVVIDFDEDGEATDADRAALDEDGAETVASFTVTLSEPQDDDGDT